MTHSRLASPLLCQRRQKPSHRAAGTHLHNWFSFCIYELRSFHGRFKAVGVPNRASRHKPWRQRDMSHPSNGGFDLGLTVWRRYDEGIIVSVATGAAPSEGLAPLATSLRARAA